MKKTTDLDLITIFDNLLKENRLTKKVLLGTKRDPMSLFGKYHEIKFSYSNNIYELCLFKTESLTQTMDLSFVNKNYTNVVGTMNLPYLAFKLYSEFEDKRGEFDLHIFKANASESYDNYKLLINDKENPYKESFETYHKNLKQIPLVIGVKIGNNQIVLTHKDIETQY